jgi:Right handed beta helix region
VHSLATTTLTILALLSTVPADENATVSGEVSTPHPTILNLAIEWRIAGDANLNGTVSVRYRAVGENRWRDAMALRRVPAGQSRRTTPIFHWENKHSGSIFDLQPNTEYEIALALEDPDGGRAERTVRARTRPVPRPAAGAALRSVSKADLATARPGEILLLSAGDYGAFVVPRDGEAGRPIVYRAPDGGAVFSSISLRDRKYVQLEGLTIKNSDERAAGIDLLGAQECAVRHCKISSVYGIRASRPPGARDCYIADNVARGITPWLPEAMGANGKNIGEGIQVTGPGNVICFNRVTGFRDCISTMEDRGTCDQFCIDIYNNDVYVGADDGIEADFCFHNCRIMRNRLTNCFVGLSSQPGLGGPTYFIRNAMYNLTYTPFKLNRFSQGDVILHNTAIKVGDGLRIASACDYTFARNNLCIGGPAGGQRFGGYGAGRGDAAAISSPGPHCSFDYDAIGTFETPFAGNIGRQRFSSLEELRRGPNELHGIRADMSVFDHVAFPIRPVPELDVVGLQPRAGAVVIDAAVLLPNINDNFRGAGPDVGAYEAGAPLPHYGPRLPGIDEEAPGRL